MSEQTGSPREWLIPFAFVVCAGWAIWHLPAYIMDFIPHENESLHQQMSELHERKDILAWPGLFGGYADFLDWLALVLMPIVFAFGMRDIRIAHMEFAEWRPVDRFSLFIGRITMILIISMTLIMLYEVFLRYVFEAPTLWANELTLWIAGYVFLFSGLYAMQQRCHIRIFILYDIVPRWAQHAFDVVSVALLNIFAAFLIYGSYSQVFGVKFYRWEMFGTAFDPPIPATVQPMILIVIVLITIQATINLIADWNLEPTAHTAADDIDQDELDAIKRAVGEK
ncbi:MAG: TRAP transporter small permease subunit [Gammaproteobacteria bacterium]|nr:TRAP transporter small permease subunit [Gammaproteobacteria bacterium]